MGYLNLEIKKLLKLPAYRFSVLVILGILIIKNILPLFSKDLSRFDWVNSFIGSLDLLIFLGGFGMLIVAVQFTISEYTNRTLQLAISSGISRKKFLLSKSIALIIGTYIFVLLGIILSFIILAIVSSILGKFNLSNLNITALGTSILVLPLKIFPLLFFAFFLTILTRSSVIPTASLIFYAAIGEFILSYFLSFSFTSRLLPLLPGKITIPLNTVTTQQLNTIVQNKIAIDTSTLPLSGSLVGILGYIIFFTLISYLIFHEQDLSR